MGEDKDDRSVFLGQCFKEVLKIKHSITGKTLDKDDESSQGAVENE